MKTKVDLPKPISKPISKLVKKNVRVINTVEFHFPCHQRIFQKLFVSKLRTANISVQTTHIDKQRQNPLSFYTDLFR